MQQWIKQFEIYQAAGRLIERDDCNLASALRLRLALEAKAGESHKVYLDDRFMRFLSSAHLLCGALSPVVKWNSVTTVVKKRLRDVCVPVITSLCSEKDNAIHHHIWDKFNGWVSGNWLQEEHDAVRTVRGKSAFATFWEDLVVSDQFPILSLSARKLVFIVLYCIVFIVL